MAIAARLQSPAARFVTAGAAWALALFALLRLPWVETFVVLPVTRWQGRWAAALGGVPPLSVDVTLACSGTDVVALSLAAILAYPASRGFRAAGAAGALALILVMNVVRIAALGHAAASPALFRALHLYVFPAGLVLCAGSYVYLWMCRAPLPAGTREVAVIEPSRRFGFLAAFLILMFVAAAPWYVESRAVFAVTALVAGAAAEILQAFGQSAVSSGGVLTTARGAFAVTHECVSTPLVPIYLAAAITFISSTRVRLAACAMAVPLFIGLGVARLLLVAVPVAVADSPLFLVHAFYQLLSGVLLVAIAGYWRHAPRAAWKHVALGLTAGLIALMVLAPISAGLVAEAPRLEDPQGAIAFFPAFQVALIIALWTVIAPAGGWRELTLLIAPLVALQVAFFAAAGAWAAVAALAAHVTVIRAWSVAAPVAMVLARKTLHARHA